jgi:hypothetical protein
MYSFSTYITCFVMSIDIVSRLSKFYVVIVYKLQTTAYRKVL